MRKSCALAGVVGKILAKLWELIFISIFVLIIQR